MSKGVVNTVTLVEAFITTILIISSFSSISSAITGEFKEKMTDIQVQRIDNAALGLSSTYNSSIEMEMSNYEVSYSEGEIIVGYRDSNSSVEFGSGKYNYDQVRAPRNPKTIPDRICVSREPEQNGNLNTGSGGFGVGVGYDYTLVIEVGGCS